MEVDRSDEVERREFVKSALATAGAGVVSGRDRRVVGEMAQEFYQLRKYNLRSGPQLAIAQDYFEKALIPALSRLRMGPVGAFKLDIGAETPTYYVLIPAASVQTLATLEALLERDADYVKAAEGFRDATAETPAFVREERSLLSAFTAWPKLVAPKKGKRIFQLRTYESTSQATHARKVKMFNDAEIGLFVRHGLAPVFFGDTLVGTRMPSLTYMLTFADMAEMSKNWATFSADPEWKELSHKAGNTDPEIVSNISNLFLSPLDCSQI
jgi:hypothetical protein